MDTLLITLIKVIKVITIKLIKAITPIKVITPIVSIRAKFAIRKKYFISHKYGFLADFNDYFLYTLLPYFLNRHLFLKIFLKVLAMPLNSSSVLINLRSRFFKVLKSKIFFNLHLI